MKPKFKTVDEAKQALIPEINKALDTVGVWERVQSSGTAAGEEPLCQYALEWFQRHTPDNWHITATLRPSGCIKWAVTIK